MRTMAAARVNRGEGAALRPIPYFDVPGPLQLLAEVPASDLERILASGRRHYGRAAMRWGEWLSCRWLERSQSPYRHEIAAVAAHLGAPGAALLNLSFEWSCSSAAVAAAEGGNRLLRTLDWPLDGLGRHLVVARHEGAAGPWITITWPGFVGALTAMAPGRFSAAINQPPMRRFTPSLILDWAINRRQVWANPAMPPAHLLRHVFETARSYAEARERLRDEPICLPAFFTLSGVEADEGCVIERLETAAAVHDEAPACITNHWRAFALPSRMRGDDSHARLAQLAAVAPSAAADLSWLAPPVLNPTTRLAAVANAARGTLIVQGFEADGPVTQPFSLTAPPPGERGGAREDPRPAAPVLH